MNFFARAVLPAVLALTSLSVCAQQATGTLNFEVKPFTSEVELKPKIQSQLESGGIEWGVKDGQVVITMVNKRFVDFDISHMTRFGKSEQVTLPAGNYRVTAIGLEMHTAFSVEKVLNKGAYVNEDVLSFSIEEGKTTTLSVLPVIRKDMTFFVKWYMPALLTSVVTDAGSGSEKVINARGEGSIAWPKYSGALKFVAK
ncbi:MAG: hypothetical protein JNN30_15335 [Rhodanobacteraceae bacterium]|nr:hypothetical protein [Rhodanobacteraceae bacterium]